MKQMKNIVMALKTLRAVIQKVATENCLKPLLSQKDNLMVDTHRYTFAELNNDSVPELITGAIDETDIFMEILINM